MRFYFLVFIIFFSINIVKADLFNINLMAFYSSQTILRGAQTWPRFFLFTAPGFEFFNRKLSLYGPNITSSFFDKKSPFQIAMGFKFINDDRPFIRYSNDIGDYRNKRRNALEFFFRSAIQLGIKKKYRLALYMGRDLINYKKFYSELNASMPILPLTSFTGSLSWAQGDANRYLYGPEAVSGYGFGSIGVRTVIPFVPWNGIIINSLENSWVLKGSNRAADYVRGKGEHLTFATRWIWNIY